MQTVHEDIHDDVVERLKKAYAQVRIGDPLEGKWFDKKKIYIIYKAPFFALYWVWGGPLYKQQRARVEELWFCFPWVSFLSSTIIMEKSKTSLVGSGCRYLRVNNGWKEMANFLKMSCLLVITL